MSATWRSSNGEMAERGLDPDWYGFTDGLFERYRNATDGHEDAVSSVMRHVERLREHPKVEREQLVAAINLYAAVSSN